MNSKCYDTATELIQYFSVNRGVGHTTTMLDGVNPDTLIIAHNSEWANELSKKSDAICVSLQSIPNGKLRGLTKPLVLDNAATLILLNGLVSEIRELKEQNAKHRMTIEMIKQIIKE